MSTTADVDFQAESILKGLSRLISLLDEPIAREALDLDKDIKTADSYSILLKLRKSLTQYLAREGDLLYVGLLGHFSSGKSSTINSLLDLYGTQEERELDFIRQTKR